MKEGTGYLLSLLSLSLSLSFVSCPAVFRLPVQLGGHGATDGLLPSGDPADGERVPGLASQVGQLPRQCGAEGRETEKLCKRLQTPRPEKTKTKTIEGWMRGRQQSLTQSLFWWKSNHSNLQYLQVFQKGRRTTATNPIPKTPRTLCGGGHSEAGGGQLVEQHHRCLLVVGFGCVESPVTDAPYGDGSRPGASFTM